MKDIKVFLKKKKKKSNYIITKNIKIFQKIKSIGQLSTENYTKKNCLTMIIRNYCCLENLTFSYGCAR